jgi:hypothetical protein
MDEFFNVLSKDEKQDFSNIEVDFVRVFNSVSGKRVLKYLISITLARYLAPNATDSELRYLEGERFLVSFILNMIKKGKG